MKASGHIEPYIFHPHGGGKAKLTWAVYVNGQRTSGYWTRKFKARAELRRELRIARRRSR